MSRSDSKIDLEKYKPSREDVLRVADEDAAQERLRRALDNPQLDAAIAQRDRGPDAVERPAGAASPWAAATSEEPAIDKAALPSATAPVAPPVTTPIETDDPGPRGKRWSPANKALAAVVLAFLPAMVVFLLFVRPPPSGSSAPTATVSAPPAPASAALIKSAAPPLSVEPPTPSVIATAVPVAPSGAPSTAPQPQGVKPVLRGAPRVTPSAPPGSTPAIAPTVSPSAAPPHPPSLPKFVQ